MQKVSPFTLTPLFHLQNFQSIFITDEAAFEIIRENTKGCTRTKKSCVDSIIVGMYLGHIDAASLNGIVCFCVEHPIYTASAPATSAHYLFKKGNLVFVTL